MRIVLDTNVVVSGILSTSGPPGRILDLLFSGQLTLLYDDRILAEYGEVLARPRFRVEPEERTALLDALAASGESVPAPPLDLLLPDPDDLPFVEVGSAAGADALVTGNLRHFRAVRGLGLRVASPVSLLEALRSGRWS